jgi:hypothetical protein
MTIEDISIVDIEGKEYEIDFYKSSRPYPELDLNTPIKLTFSFKNIENQPLFIKLFRFKITSQPKRNLFENTKSNIEFKDLKVIGINFFRKNYQQTTRNLFSKTSNRKKRQCFRNVVAPFFAKMYFRPKEGIAFLPPKFSFEKQLLQFYWLRLKIFQIKKKASVFSQSIAK